MKYVVSRSNCYPEENPQCPGAQKELIPKDGRLSESYTVELDSLEDLNMLSKKVGYPVIVFPVSGWGFDIPEIEIYDDYRE